MPKAVGLSKTEAKRKVVDALASGLTVKDACASVGRSVKSYENWRSEDPDFRAACDEARARRKRAIEAGKDSDVYQLDFATWRKRFLGMDTYPHQQQWIDVLEGREPADLHPSIQYQPGRPDRVLLNTPPFHCATLDTPVFTRDGWKTVGTVSADDWLLGVDGLFWPVYDQWMSDGDVDLFDVVFDTGDVITTDADHIWAVTKTMTGAKAELTTRQLATDLRWNNKAGTIKWKVRIGEPFDAPDADLPVDPYLLGYWLGDGDRNGSRLTVSVGDLPSLTGHLDGLGLTYSVRGDSRNPDSTKVVYVHGIRRLLPLGNKRVPDAYFTGSYKQRLSLLQGLMDTDGTINAKDGRASFIQVDDGLARDVYRLVSSLGFKATWKHEKQGRTAPNGTPRSETVNRIYFKPNGEAVFRLDRKASKQKVTGLRCRTNYRTVREVRPAGRGPVRCLSVASPGDLYAIGDAMIQTHNAKSATITRDYITYCLCMNPNYRVIIVSKTQQQAKKFLYSIRQILTSSVYAELQAAYAPEGGFKGSRDDGAWTANMIYLAGRDSAEKDPSVEALGIGGQIYGARADLIVLDDAVTLGNANDHEKQMTWINQEVSSRLKGGKLLVVGTRVATTDLYSELRNGDNYLSGTSPWTYLGQPCVLEYADAPEDWVTLWPRSTQPLDENATPDADGMFDAWSGPALHGIREAVKPATWALVYMQQAIADDATFHPTCVWGSVDKRRKAGPMRPGEWGGRRDGMQGLHVIGSVDPAGTGEAFILAYAVDRQTGDRWVLDAWMHSGASNLTWYLDMIGRLHSEYGMVDLVVESNAYSSWLIHDDRIVDYCRDRGIKISPHYTGNNKADPDFGVASIAPLFGRTERIVEGGRPDFVKGSNKIHLPDPGKSAAIKALIEQLLTWQPGKQGRQLRQDGPMALWFAELRARTVVTGEGRGRRDFIQNPYLSRRDRNRQYVVPLHVVA